MTWSRPRNSFGMAFVNCASDLPMELHNDDLGIPKAIKRRSPLFAYSYSRGREDLALPRSNCSRRSRGRRKRLNVCLAIFEQLQFVNAHRDNLLAELVECATPRASWPGYSLPRGHAQRSKHLGAAGRVEMHLG